MLLRQIAIASTQVSTFIPYGQVHMLLKYLIFISRFLDWPYSNSLMTRKMYFPNQDWWHLVLAAPMLHWLCFSYVRVINYNYLPFITHINLLYMFSTIFLLIDSLHYSYSPLQTSMWTWPMANWIYHTNGGHRFARICLLLYSDHLRCASNEDVCRGFVRCFDPWFVLFDGINRLVNSSWLLSSNEGTCTRHFT